MKDITFYASLLLLVGSLSCRDTKKEQEQVDQVIEKVESIEKQVEETSAEVEQKAKEVEDALKALDSI